jgi:hypothetical protein
MGRVVKMLATLVVITVVDRLVVSQSRQLFFADLQSSERRFQFWEGLYS